MIRRIAVALAALLLVGGTLAWFNRAEVLLFIISRSTAMQEVAPERTIAWSRGPAVAPAGERPPNIVFILADDLGINDISTFGGGVAGGRVPTPNIDRLAAQGAIFTQSYSGTATCAPSRAMLMTGRYPTRHGFEFTPTPDGMSRALSMMASTTDNGLPPFVFNEQRSADAPPFAQQGLPQSEVTIAEMLKPLGYHNVHIGKWHLGNGKAFGPNAQGFDESLLMASGLHLPEDDPQVVNARVAFDPIDRFLWARMTFANSFNDGPWFRPGGYLADYWTDEAVKVIEANRNRPFFLYLAHWGVHNPLQATRADYEAVGDVGSHRLRVYAAMVRAVDRSVGRVMEALDRQGLADNTIIVFSSDNGGAGYIGLPEINAPYRGWKLTLYEGGIRVPLFVRWPARIAAGTRIERPTAHIDLAPTLAAAAGAPLPSDRPIDGIDLLADSPQPRPDDALHWQSAHYRAVRQGDWKLQVSERPKMARLYNLATDPTERRDLAASEPARLAAMQALIARHQQGARPPLYPHTIEGPVAVDKPLGVPFRKGDAYVYWPN